MKTFKRAHQNAEQSAIILMLSTIAVKIIGACFKIPLSSKEFLGDLGFGYFSVVYDLFMPFYTLAISGLPTALSHIIAEFAAQKRFKDIKNTFSLTRKLFILFGALFSVLISLLAIPLIYLTDTSGNTLYSVYAVIPSIFLCFMISVYRGYYEGLKNMNPTAVSKIIEAFGKLILGLGFAFVVIKLTENPALAAGAAMFGITVGTLVSTIYLHINYKINGDLITKDELEQSPSVLTNRKTIKLILSLAIPMALSSLISSAVSVIDALTVRGLLEKEVPVLLQTYSKAIESYDSYYKVDFVASDLPTFLYGLRSKAFTLFNLIPTITISFGVGALPVLSECWIKKDMGGVKTNINLIIKMMSIVVLPSGIAFIAVGKPIMSLLYSSYGSTNIGGNLLMIFGFSAIFAGFAIPLTSVLQSLDRQFIAFGNILVGVALKVVLNILLVSNTKINIYGSAISTTVCYLYIFIAHTYKILKITGGTQNIKNSFLKPLLAAVCSSATAYLICLISNSKTTIICGILAAVLVYIVVIFILKTLSKEEILDLPKGQKLYLLAKKMKIMD